MCLLVNSKLPLATNPLESLAHLFYIPMFGVGPPLSNRANWGRHFISYVLPFFYFLGRKKILCVAPYLPLLWSQARFLPKMADKALNCIRHRSPSIWKPPNFWKMWVIALVLFNMWQYVNIHAQRIPSGNFIHNFQTLSHQYVTYLFNNGTMS